MSNLKNHEWYDGEFVRAEKVFIELGVIYDSNTIQLSKNDVQVLAEYFNIIPKETRKRCPRCNDPALVGLRTMGKKMCSACGLNPIPWPLDKGQEPVGYETGEL